MITCGTVDEQSFGKWIWLECLSKSETCVLHLEEVNNENERRASPYIDSMYNR